MRPPEDFRRELEKVLDAVRWVSKALQHQAEHDAAMHMNPLVRHNPATVNLMQAEADLERLIEETRE